MTLSIILCVLSSLSALILAYGYIKIANQKDKDFKNKSSELDQYKLAIATIEKFVNMPEGKRLGLSSSIENNTLGILSRCGFGIRVIFDLDKGSDHIEVYRLKQDLNNDSKV